uniref:Uncharacterized protein n=1 Tax=Guillardia theta TaxID=55529 RepID=A0A7S4KB65_GUITH|mmetsp:Transcript_22539/g.73924  ORF Transcript_22539/g.73924 Transcript_22539/m.73924 type:complete len:492 (+) Transcript_22539:30-1505(+)
MERAALLGERGWGRRRSTVHVLLAAAAAAALVVVVLQQNRRVELVETIKDVKSCWMCPCCNGCEQTGAAIAAGCGRVSKNARGHEKLAKKAAKNPKMKQMTAAIDNVIQDVFADKRKTSTAQTPKSKRSSGFNAQQKQFLKSLIDRELSKFTGLKRLPDTMANHNENLNRFSNVSAAVHPDTYKLEPLDRKVGDMTEANLFAPEMFGKDEFENRTVFKDGKVAEFHPWNDPVGLTIENPEELDPWYYSAGQHWDKYSPEAKHLENPSEYRSGDLGELDKKVHSFSTDTGKLLKEGKMTHGSHQTWKDVKDPQWGWQHQFADWDPDSDANKRLVWGEGQDARTGLEDPKDKRVKGKYFNHDEIPWELSFVNKDLKGDDFVPSEEYQEQTNPSYAKKHENSFSHMKETDPKNEQIVFGTAGQGTSSIRQRFKVPVEDNWNLVTDSSVDYDKVKDELASHSVGNLLPYSGEPLTDFATNDWQGGNGVAHSQNFP